MAKLALTVSNPPTQAQMQAVVNKLNELITKLHGSDGATGQRPAAAG